MEISERQLHRALVMSALLTTGAIVYEILAFTHDGTSDQLQRVITLQLALGLVALLCFIVNCGCALAFLLERNLRTDMLAKVSAQIGVLSCSVLLVIGATMTRCLFAVWWRWNDDQVAAYLLVWLIYVSYLLLRHFANLDEAPALASMVGLFAVCSLPAAYFFASLRKAQLCSLLQRTWMTSSDSLVNHFVMLGTLAILLAWARYKAATREQPYSV